MGKHEGKGKQQSGGKHAKPKGERKKNTSDPQTCAHNNHSKQATADDRGGYDRHCGSCKSKWWTPN